MSAVSKDHLDLILELQALPTLKSAFLAGGTNLALRFNHRQSIDIDLFLDHQIGLAGYDEIEHEIGEYFEGKLLKFLYPVAEDDEFIFARALIIRNGATIKIEVLQNMSHLDKIEDLDGIRLASTRDIGLYKLMAASNRTAQKDIYDLDLFNWKRC